MGLFPDGDDAAADEKSSPLESSPNGSARASLAPNAPVNVEDAPVTWLAIILGALSSLGGFMFGYESGQISGFMQMTDFVDRFGVNGEFTAVRSGTIVALLCAGTLIGCLASGWICDRIGRRYTISASAYFYIIGVAIEITSSRQWVQVAMGRFTAGLGIGALSTSVPMYQSESVPKRIRGVVVSSYQLLITLGIWLAYMINFGTNSAFTDSAQWRITIGLSAAWAIILGTGILFLPESPRYAYRMGKEDEARRNMGRLNGVSPNSALIDAEIHEIEKKLAAERAGGDHPLSEIFTGPRMLYRTILGMVLQAGQQLTGANFFFYFGTTIFKSTGISNSFITSIILGSVNVGATVGGLWIVANVGRRKALMWGAAVMCVCFIIYTFVGRFVLDTAPLGSPLAKSSGSVLIVFTCFFVIAFATTWGPLVWAIVGELYPARYRAPCMALATASNWLLNFFISFFTTFITNDIGYLYGLVFAVSTFCLFWIVYFFVIESFDRSLEEIDTMYVLGVPPRQSASWDAKNLGPVGVGNVGTDGLFFDNGARGIKNNQPPGADVIVHDETRYLENPMPGRSLKGELA